MNEFIDLTQQYPMHIVEGVAQACGARMKINGQTKFAGNMGDLGYRRDEFPQAEFAASQVLALPLYPELSAAQQEAVVEKIQAFYRR
jgi:dTDP-4-amino-4,6-dideoxygalactose transaminase